MQKLTATLTLLALLFAAPAAWAHASLEQASPAAGATLASPPANLQLTFSEALWPQASNIVVTREDGTEVPLVITAPAPTALTATPKSPLTPGTYQLKWHVTCVYGHQTQGSYRFTVQ